MGSPYFENALSSPWGHIFCCMWHAFMLLAAFGPSLCSFSTRERQQMSRRPIAKWGKGLEAMKRWEMEHHKSPHWKLKRLFFAERFKFEAKKNHQKSERSLNCSLREITCLIVPNRPSTLPGKELVVIPFVEYEFEKLGSNQGGTENVLHTVDGWNPKLGKVQVAISPFTHYLR